MTDPVAIALIAVIPSTLTALAAVLVAWQGKKQSQANAAEIVKVKTAVQLVSMQMESKVD